jgi:hypothetical protein
VPPIPNWLAAFIVQTRLFPDVVNIVSNRVTAVRVRTFSPQDPRGWQMPTSGIVYRSIAGTVKREFQAPLRWQPLQVETYGADDRLADELYRTLWSAFVPQDMTKPHGFVVPSLGASILTIDELAAPFIDYERDSGWPRVIGNWWVQLSEQPTNIVYGSAALGATTRIA